MENIKTRLADLFSKKEWTREEYEWYLELIRVKSPLELQQYFQEDYLASLSKEQAGDLQHAQTLLRLIHQKASIQPEQPTVVQMTARKNRWLVAAAVAGIIMMLGVSYFIITGRNKKAQPVTVTQLPIPEDVMAPQNSRAMITLADGKKVYLDSLNKGQLALQDNVKLVKLATGEIVYRSENGKTINEQRYNTLVNPKGSQVAAITFSDGSKAWLNAGSSLTYPVAFVEKERKVVVSGEVYFEVASSVWEGEKRPFLVQANEVTTEVLGTHFNVNSYNDEPDVKVTLLEGAVRISKHKESKLLKPGEQAQVSSAIKIINDADLDEVMAWMNGHFQFEGASVEEVMRQLSRWYNVEIIYEGKPAEQHFRGGISRNVEVSKVFKMLETTGAVHFKIEGKRIIVIP
ncbi:hypothetical protein A3860_09255 [Niastella vici]|uniref:Iron dicitrate transport regulator FecR n=1 Tax=Niastella vici TaxID=1703345 RepID=A0A1V9FHQ8_9BACT|nr:FecR family protein [Niastella vici]OQP57801.1 hypothetical protein A3860_09255 [Niastella vici]